MLMDLRLARDIARLSQRQLAELSGVDPTSISQLENGKRDIYRMSYGSVARLAAALGVEPTRLWPAPLVPIPELSEDDERAEART